MSTTNSTSNTVKTSNKNSLMTNSSSKNNINKLAPSATSNTTKNKINTNIVENTKNSLKSNINLDISEKLKDVREKTGYFDIVADNYFLLIGLSFALVILILVYFCSSSFRVQRCTERMLLFQNYQSLKSLNYSSVGDTFLGDYYITSAYNPCHCGYQMFDYTSEKVLLACLQSGARYLDLSIFNSEFGPNAYPVVSMGYRQGEWKMMATDTPLEICFQLIAKNAFSVKQGSSGVYNPDDPLFIGLNLNTNSNLACLNVIAALITKYFTNRLLDAAYSFQNSDDIGSIKMSKLMGKIVFFSSDGFQGSGLEEIINYCWDNYDNNPNHAMQRLYYKDISAVNYNTMGLINYNRTGITIIVPHKEGDILNGNYDPTIAFQLGCQMVSMEFQYIDSYMDAYITQFKNSSFIMKDDSLRQGGQLVTKTTKANDSENSTPTSNDFVNRNGQNTTPQTTNLNIT